LCGGIADGTGNPDTTNCTTATGTIAATDAEGDGDQLTFTLGQPTTALCSGGKPICWEGVGTGTLIGKAGDQTIITVSIGEHSGAYDVTLSGPIDHSDPYAEDTKSLSISVDVSDGQAITSTTLTVKIEDDSPRAADIDIDAEAGGGSASANLVIVLDVSGSMDTTVSDTEQTRLELAKEAVQNLLATTNVTINQVMVIAFSGGVAQDGILTWTDKGSADTFVQNLGTGGGTWYDAALTALDDNWGDGPTQADQNLLYFITDGAPTNGHGANTTNWENFFAGHNIDISYAIGINTQTTNTALAPIAWSSEDSSFSPVILESPSGLDNTLQATVSIPTHNIFTDTMNVAGFGADGGYIKSVEVDGVEYTFDGNNSIISGSEGPVSQGSSISVATALGGWFTFYFVVSQAHAAGDWTYTPPDTLTAPADEVFHYILTDNDGDKAGADITVSVTAANYSPAVDLDSTQPGTGYVTSVAPDDTAVAVFGDHVSITDADSANLQSALVSFQGDYTYDDLFVDGTGLAGATIEYNGHAGTYDGLTWQYSGGGSGINLAITGDASVATYAELLNAVWFSSHSGNLADREISVTVSDGTSDSAVAIAIVQFETPQTNEAPVFDASGIAAIFGQSSVTVTGVTLSDADAGSDILSGSITAEHGTLTLASSNLNNVTGAGTANLSGQGTLNEINAALDDGIVYTPNQQSPPATDKVALTVDDGHGGTDSLTFLFAVAQSGVTLEGTSGKDVIMASPGDDTLTGHDGTDAFVFGPYFGAANSDVITDFSGHGGDGDFLILSGFSVDNFDELLGHLTDVEHGNGVHDTVIAVEQNTITLQNVAALTLSEADFIFHPANIL
jgi:Mg-chelatase subunit ChlD